MKAIYCALLAASALAAAGCTSTEPVEPGAPAASTASRPTIILIVADDLGYSDLGAWGGEIATPNLDRLAARGIQYTDFHTGQTCSPTRAMLMTGVDHHRAGMGAMAESLRFNPQMRGQPGYEGHLNDRVVTVAELLRDAGYATRMVGKWHLGSQPGDLPGARGFGHSFVLLPGGGQHFDGTKAIPFDDDATLREDDSVASWPVDRYSTDYFTDRMIGYLREVPAGQPVFAYVAYTAPHWPLQAPDEYLAKWVGRYDAGWDEVRARRVARLRELGLLRADEEPAPRPNKVPAWDTLGRDEQRYEARMMEIYAAMVDNLDHNVGRLLESLHETGRDRNSVIVFLSDNGAEAMVPQNATLPGLKDWIAKNFDNRLENLGHAGSYVGYGPRWAHVSNAPQRSYKGTAYEGGHKVPAFIVVPGGDQMRVDGYAHVLDLPPTLLQVAGVALPQGSYAGRPVLGMEGRPLLDAGLKPVPADPARVASGELFGHRGLRRGEWKAVSRWLGRDGSAPWELYDLARDPGEQQDLAAGRPAELAELVRLHDAWATTNGVILPSRDAPAFGVE